MPDVAETPAAMAGKLAKRLAAEPNDLEGWMLLGRTYSTLEQFPLAVRAYQRADRLANGQNADAIVGVAESLLAQDFEQIRGAAGHLFDRALVVDPDNPKALLYGAFAALSRGESPTRARTLPAPADAESAAPDPRHHQQAAGRDSMARAAAPAQAHRRKGRAAKVAVHVTLAPSLAGTVPAGAALFVAARDPKSPGPPFAVKRLPAAFPVDVELSARRRHARIAAHHRRTATRSGRACRAWAERRPQPAATRSDKLAIMSAKTES